MNFPPSSQIPIPSSQAPFSSGIPMSQPTIGWHSQSKVTLPTLDAFSVVKTRHDGSRSGSISKNMHRGRQGAFGLGGGSTPERTNSQSALLRDIHSPSSMAATGQPSRLRATAPKLASTSRSSGSADDIRTTSRNSSRPRHATTYAQSATLPASTTADGNSASNSDDLQFNLIFPSLIKSVAQKLNAGDSSSSSSESTRVIARLPSRSSSASRVPGVAALRPRAPLRRQNSCSMDVDTGAGAEVGGDTEESDGGAPAHMLLAARRVTKSSSTSSDGQPSPAYASSSRLSMRSTSITSTTSSSTTTSTNSNTSRFTRSASLPSTSFATSPSTSMDLDDACDDEDHHFSSKILESGDVSMNMSMDMDSHYSSSAPPIYEPHHSERPYAPAPFKPLNRQRVMPKPNEPHSSQLSQPFRPPFTSTPIGVDTQEGKGRSSSPSSNTDAGALSSRRPTTSSTLMSNPTLRSVGIPTSHNRPPPPRLGMRGPPTLSQQQRTTSSSTTALPTKQRSFKVPLLPKQPQNVALMDGTNESSSSRPIPNAAAVVSSSKPPASGLPKKRGRDAASSSNQVVASSAHEPARAKSPPVPIPTHMDDADDECEEGDTHGDSSFGDISLEWDDEFEKVMSTYD